ncbi:MAG: IS4 family transposase [Deltaproteobacteria bacterium]|nr:IS4 family transposase [Deltaproteobacteria bacterium]
MHTGRIIFSQLMDFLPKHEFNKCVHRYQGNHWIRTFSCFDQFLCMAFAQLTYRESLRDIETCLRAMQPKLYHAGIRGRVSRSTLADANEKRDWRIYADFAHVLIQRARQMYAGEDLGIQLNQTAYALDSTTIDLCLSLFPWATFRQNKGAIKLHTEMDLRGCIPCVIRITHGKVHDVTFLDQLVLEPAAFYIMDRGYTDFARLYRFTQHMAFFVTRAKSNLDYTRRSSDSIDPGTGLRSDQTILLRGPKTSHLYPDPLRRISFFDIENHRRLVFLTNNFALPALTIALLFKCRWQIELFFKWIKQNLRIKSFYGTSENAVKTQIWIAISIYVLVAIIKKQLHIDRTLNEILQVLSITLFENDKLLHLLTNFHLQDQTEPVSNQLTLFNF